MTMIINPGQDRVEMPNGENIPRISLITLIQGVKTEKMGVRLTRHFNCTKMAKAYLGTKTRNRDVLIESLQKILEDATD